MFLLNFLQNRKADSVEAMQIDGFLQRLAGMLLSPQLRLGLLEDEVDVLSGDADIGFLSQIHVDSVNSAYHSFSNPSDSNQRKS